MYPSVSSVVENIFEKYAESQKRYGVQVRQSGVSETVREGREESIRLFIETYTGIILCLKCIISLKNH